MFEQFVADMMMFLHRLYGTELPLSETSVCMMKGRSKSMSMFAVNYEVSEVSSVKYYNTVCCCYFLFYFYLSFICPLEIMKWPSFFCDSFFLLWLSVAIYIYLYLSEYKLLHSLILNYYFILFIYLFLFTYFWHGIN